MKNSSHAPVRKRRRNATATRQAMLESARRAFTRHGYDGVGARDIARGAGVTAMMVNRYFGSKERLFEEVVEVTLSSPGILTREVTHQNRRLSMLGKDVAKGLIARTTPGTAPMDGFLILLRSAANESAAAILREKFVRHFANPLASKLAGKWTAERAEIFLALIAGFQVMRQIVGMPALAKAKPAVLCGQLERLFEQLVTPIKASEQFSAMD